jgi:hypothetical protein
MSVNPSDVLAGRALGRPLVVNDALFEPGSRGAISESVARIEVAQEELARRTLRSPDRAAPSTADLAELTAIQSVFEPLFAGVFEVASGNAAPQPLPTESPLEYRIRLCDHLRPLSPSRKDEALGRVATASATAFNECEADIIRDVRARLDDRSQGSFLRPGELRASQEVDQSGRVSTVYSGDPYQWMRYHMDQNPSCVVGFTRGHAYGLAPVPVPRTSVDLPTPTPAQLRAEANRLEREQQLADNLKRRFPRRAA